MRADLDAALALITAAPPRLGGVRLVAVDGPSGSGKSVFSRRLAAALTRSGVRTQLFHTDALATWDEPFDWWPRLEAGLLAPLQAGRRSRVQVNSWIDGVPRPGRVIARDVPEVLVLDGVSSGRSAVADRLSVLIWVEVPDRGTRLERAVSRDGEESRPQLLRWQAAEDVHFSRDDTGARADLRVTPG